MSLVNEKSKTFMAHIYCGDPSVEQSKQYIQALIKNGIDILELGIPFSDPVADGKVFQEACQRALHAKTTVEDVFQVAQEFKDTTTIVLTTYYNIIHKIGTEEFIQKCTQNGIKGLIVPDLSLEESDELREECIKYNIHLIYLITPTTPDERIKKILSVASGFIYLVSFAGVTGIAKEVDTGNKQIIEKIKSIKDIPVLVGFGIKSQSDVTKILSLGADGVIIGSQICRLYQENIEKMKGFVKEISEACQE